MEKAKLKKNSLIYLLIVLYPILPLNIYIGPLSLANIDSLAIVMLFFLKKGNLKIKNVFKYDMLFWIYLVVYGVFSFLTASMMAGIAWFISTIAVSLVLIHLINSEEDVYRIIDSLSISAFVLGFIGIFESLSRHYLIQTVIFEEWSDRFRYGLLRCAGPFGHPINFAFFQAIAALFCFYRLQNGNISKQKKRFLIFTYLIAIISMMMTVSRLPICFFVAAQFILIIRLGVRKAVKYMMSATILVVMLLIILDTAGIGVFTFIFDLFASLLKMVGITSSIDYSTVKGFGNRLDLYSWVFNAVGKDFLFGKGINATFEYKLADWFTKTSIEVHYLYIYFRCGLVGVCSLVLSYIGTLKLFIKNRYLHFQSEKKIQLVPTLISILLLYYICLFGVQETDLTRLYCELIAIGIAYIRVCKRIKFTE